MKDHTQLLRQVHPDFIQDGRVSSQAFKPTPKDEKQLSVYDGDQISAVDSYQHYTETLNLPSDGVLAVTVEECTNLELPAEPKPLENFPEHATIDFSRQGTASIEKKSKLLRAKAMQRDWLFQNTGS